MSLTKGVIHAISGVVLRLLRVGSSSVLIRLTRVFLSVMALLFIGYLGEISGSLKDRNYVWILVLIQVVGLINCLAFVPSI